MANSISNIIAGSGKIITDFGGNDYGWAMTIQSDGKILVSGLSNGDFALARYNNDGSLDTTFSGDGRVTTRFSGNDIVFGAAVQPDGKILVSGASNGDFTIVRYNPDGSLDTSFSGDGKVTTSVGIYNEIGCGVTALPGGKILAAGLTFDVNHNGNIALARYNADGTLDTSFSGDGIVTTDLGHDEQGFNAAVQSDGKILVAGATWLGDGHSNFFLVRYNGDGSLDSSFSGDGIVTTGFNYRDEGWGVAVQSDGKLLVSGASNGDFALVRYNTNGSLDTSFSGDGIVTTDFGGTDTGFKVVTQTDGKIIVAGFTSHGGGLMWEGDTALHLVEGISDFALVRYNSDGSLDTSFGTGGKVTTDFGGTDFASSITLQADGRIVVSGSCNGNIILARYNTDGSLDTSFSGGADTIAPTYPSYTTDFGGNDYGLSMTVQSNGRILVAGLSNGDFALARYNTDGSLDTTFSGDGKVTTHFSGNDFVFGSAVQPDGMILVSGGSNGDFALARYHADGSLDTTFSGDGKVTTSVGIYNDLGCGVTVLPGGKILEVGLSYDASHNGNIALVRYNADGTLDTSFSGDGIVTTDLGNDEQVMGGTVVQSDGKIVVAGSTWLGDGHCNFFLVRYNGDGSLDTSFSGDGIVTTEFNYRDEGYNLNLQADGRILVSGSSNGDFALVRYNTDGSLDTSFSGDGIVTTDFGATDGGIDVATQSDGKIIVAGSTSHQNVWSWEGDTTIHLVEGISDFALVRYNADGSLDTSFGTGGKVITDFGGTDFATGVTVLTDGKIVVSGTSNGDFLLARYNTDGSLDTSFSTVPMTTMLRNGISVMPERYSGPATAAGGAPIHFQFIGDSTGEVLIGTPYNDFINVAGGVDAVNAGAGNDVIDGGTGSNFLTGGPGTDIFFSDGRGGVTTWSTITDWQAGEQLSVWGWHPGVSRIVAWVQAGAAGYEGLTMHADLNGDGTIDTSVTFTGITSQSQLPTPQEFDGVLWFV